MAFRDIIGQDKAIKILAATLERGRVPSSYLFAGESGIGKKNTAVNLAKALNCQNPVQKRGSAKVQNHVTGHGTSGLSDFRASDLAPDCCDECPSCRKIDNQTHPDFLVIEPEKGEIRVDEIRTIDEALSFVPYEAKVKVVIVNDAETMNSSAANAFLKTLEEPPSQSMIILITSSPDMLPETIRSRCARVNFAPLSSKKCEEVIEKVLRSEEYGEKSGSSALSASGFSALARLSMGRPGLAVSNDLMEERDRFIGLFKSMMTGGREIWADREEIEKWFDFSFTLLRDLAVSKITGRAEMLINADLTDKISDLSRTIEIKDIINSYVRMSFLRGYLDFNLNKSITWNHTRFILSKFVGLASLQAGR